MLTIREILTTTGMTQKALARRFDIPLRTIENWATGKRECPVYIRKMIAEILDIEERFAEPKQKEKGNTMERIRITDTDWTNTEKSIFPDGREMLLTGWNGERWNEGRPVHRYEVEGIDFTQLEENSPEWDRAVEVVDIEL